MAWSILFIAVLIFAFRGYFLALPGVAGRLLGLVLGYWVAYNYYPAVANWLRTITDMTLPPLAFNIIAGSGLFFATGIFVGLLVKFSCQGLGKLVPALAPLLDKNALTSRITGAIGNSGIATALVLLGLWGYGLVNPSQNPDELQNTADRFGHYLFAQTAENWNISQFFSSTTTHQESPGKGTGTAVIQSSSKTLRLESSHQNEANGIALPELNLQQLSQLMQNEKLREQLQAAMQDEALMQQTEEYIRENPQALQDALNNPELQKLIQQFGQQQ